jgi:penicillin-binding protein 1B
MASQKKIKLLNKYKILTVSIAIGLLSIMSYLSWAYFQMSTLFEQEKQWTPTKIYSELISITLSDNKQTILESLNNLGYAFRENGYEITFELPNNDYPIELLPNNHWLTKVDATQNIVLEFDQADQTGSLISIQSNHEEREDLFLKPELIAILSNNQHKDRIKTRLSFEDMPAYVWKAIIAIEDQHFLSHPGLDMRGILRAIFVNFKTLSFAQGGSTITQQLIKNLTYRRSKNLLSKAHETVLAILLELKYPKEALLERYLNEVYLGQVGQHEVRGVAQGAEYFFGKTVERLNIAETATIAGLIRGPHYYSPYKYYNRCVERSHLVIQKMLETGQISPEEAKEAFEQPIRLISANNIVSKAPFFTDFIKFELQQLKKTINLEVPIQEAGLKVYTSLNLHLNQIGQRAIQESIEAFTKQYDVKQNLEAALISIDHQTGFIKTLIGGKDYSKSNFNRILNMKRQIGSTFKPIIYLASILKGRDTQGVPYGPGHPILDEPWQITYDKNKKLWSPKNYSNNFKGLVSFRRALADSLNIPAAKLGMEIGLENIIQTARQLGVRSELLAVPSLTLGVAEMTPLELTTMFANIANRGVVQEPTAIRFITNSHNEMIYQKINTTHQAIDPAAADLIINMLTEVFKTGTAAKANQLGLTRLAAGKTGTTSSYRDAWVVGFTPELTTGVWVGFDQSLPDKIKLTGGQSALPLWVKFTNAALAHTPPQLFEMSPFLIDVPINPTTGLKAACKASQIVIEKYIKGLEPEKESCSD